MTNAAVVEAFLMGRRAMARTLATDGQTVFSYMAPVAWRRGLKEVAYSTQYQSVTTMEHVFRVVQEARRRGWEVIPVGNQ